PAWTGRNLDCLDLEARRVQSGTRLGGDMSYRRFGKDWPCECEIARCRCLRSMNRYACIITCMAARTRYTFFIDERQREGLRAIKEARGVPESEQIRRAIDEWLNREGVTKAERKRATMMRVKKKGGGHEEHESKGATKAHPEGDLPRRVRSVRDREGRQRA